MEHAGDFDDSVESCPVEQEVAWAFDAADLGGDVVATVSAAMLGFVYLCGQLGRQLRP
jgi:hypothetical protein